MAVMYLPAALVAHGQDLYGCVRPTGMPPIPDGSFATLADMQAAREAVEAFLSDGEAYVSCLAKYPNNPVVSTINEQVTVQMDLVATRFNDALCAYSGGTQCAETQTEDASAMGLWEGDSTTASGPETLAGSPQGPYDRPVPYGQTEAAAPVIGLENGGNVVSLESQQTSTEASSVPVPAAGSQIKEPSFEEPTLPDGTPCGSVMQIRNDVSGDGFNLRGHYTWDVYNACFEPIRVRWTFRGDGLLNAQRSIPARGAQVIGCSTRAGTVSSRYCTGGIEYGFEWQ